MKNKKQLKSELNTLENLQEIVEAYEEIAAMRMRKVKKTVIQNREFYEGLNDIYHRVVFTFKHNLERYRDKNKNLQVIETNGKTVSVLLSANTGLYGGIVRDTFSYFIENIINSNTDVVIVGKIGRQLYEVQPNRRDFKYFEISDSGVDISSIPELLRHVLQYTHIIVYHGLYISVLTQKPTETYVTGKAIEDISRDKGNELNCIIEPSIEGVVSFFEKQILSSIFEQSLYESSLSKFASRMVSLDIASENINESIGKLNFKMLKYRHYESNKKQMERMSGISLWS